MPGRSMTTSRERSSARNSAVDPHPAGQPGTRVMAAREPSCWATYWQDLIRGDRADPLWRRQMLAVVVELVPVHPQVVVGFLAAVGAIRRKLGKGRQRELAQGRRPGAQTELEVVRADDVGQEGRRIVELDLGCCRPLAVPDDTGGTGHEPAASRRDLPIRQPGEVLQEAALALPAPTDGTDRERRAAQPGVGAVDVPPHRRRPARSSASDARADLLKSSRGGRIDLDLQRVARLVELSGSAGELRHRRGQDAEPAA